MAIDAEARARRVAGLYRIALLAVLGLALISFGHEYPAFSISREVGLALLIAAILAAIVDTSLKQELIRDAVSASLGYLLPEQLKPELGWLYDQKFIAQQSFHVRLEHVSDKNMVIFHGTVSRRVENISGETVKKTIGGGIDEWFHPNGESEITACEYRRVPKSGNDSPAIKIETQRTMFGESYVLEDLEIASEECIEFLMSYRMILSDHGMESLSYRFLIDRPQVILDVPPTLKSFVTFSHRDKYDRATETDVFSARLERMMLPHQEIHVYWHRADDVQARAEKHNITRV